MGLSQVGVLVVDDFTPFREMISSVLQEIQTVKVIGYASDGLEALQKAHELKPELILLDIGLPKLDGIEAARRILATSPETKIIFVSQDAPVDVVREALNIGARGYVIKADAVEEIVPAINAVINGERFLCSGIHGRDLI